MSHYDQKPYELSLLPPEFDFDDAAVLKALVKARTQLAELNGYSRGIPNPFLLVSPAIVQESVASSEIEAIHTTVFEVLQMELFPVEEQRKPDKEVLRYRDAINWGFQHLNKLSMSTRLISGIHSQLLEGSSGEYRRQQNRITNTRTGEVIYIPPSAEKINGLMKNWENFVNDESDEIDPLIRCAIAHYQFEAIHPFLDGNGRAGRILMILQLVNAKVLSLPILYISGFLNQNRKDYYSVIRSVTDQGKWKDFLLFMLEAFSLQAGKTKDTLFKMMSQYEALQRQCREELPKVYSADLINHLFSHPVTSPVRLATALDLHYTTASRYLNELKAKRILRDKKVGKYHLFFNLRLLNLLKD